MSATLTTPLGAPQAGLRASGHVSTSPLVAAAAAVDVAALTSGIATQYWIELVSYPGGGARLWLLVNNAWKQLDNPSASIQDVVQRTFLGTGSNVHVWYDNGTVLGLVAEGT